MFTLQGSEILRVVYPHAYLGFSFCVSKSFLHHLGCPSPAEQAASPRAEPASVLLDLKKEI